MDDEKKLMNCVTYSLGELAAQWQRPQMRVLESHLRLVNVLTESLNELQQYQLIEHNRCFRPSVAKKVRKFRQKFSEIVLRPSYFFSSTLLVMSNPEKVLFLKSEQAIDVQSSENLLFIVAVEE